LILDNLSTLLPSGSEGASDAWLPMQNWLLRLRRRGVAGPPCASCRGERPPRESLDLLVDRVPTLRVLVILTFRPEFTPPWIGRPHVTLLTLNRLALRQRAEMIAYVTGGKALPEEIADQIIDRTDGVPLFIEELTKTVVESGIVTEAGDHYALAGPIEPLAIPTSLQASLLARLDRLAPTREVAQIGAALGRSFPYEHDKLQRFCAAVTTASSTVSQTGGDRRGGNNERGHQIQGGLYLPEQRSGKVPTIS
jgi:hypothetical protein